MLYKKMLLACTLLPGFALSKEQPNILWIVTDDHRPDALNCYNQATIGQNNSELGYVSSPSLDKLASEGTLFVNSYCVSPASAPSRASMHTGKYPHHSGIYGFEYSHSHVDYYTPTLPESMEEKGYQTISVGKTGFRIMHSNPDEKQHTQHHYQQVIDYQRDIAKSGVANFYKRAVWSKGGLEGDRHEWYYPDGRKVEFWFNRKDGNVSKEDIALHEKVSKEQDLLFSYTNGSNKSLVLGGVSTMPSEQTLDGRITEEVLRYLNHEGQNYTAACGKNVQGPDAKKPIFMQVGYQFPHTPVLPSESFRAKFANKNYNIPQFDQAEYDKMPQQLKNWHDKTSIDEMSPEEKQQMVRDYYAYCAMGDSLVGVTIENFKAYSEKQNKPYIILFICGDHGWHLGEQGASTKFAPFAASNKTAVIVASSDKKKYPASKVVRQFVEFVDVAPTLLAFSGENIHKKQYSYLDGRDLAEVISGKSPARDYVIGEMNHMIGGRAYLRTNEFAFSFKTRQKGNNYNAKNNLPLEDINWATETDPLNAEMALYDLRVDPKERNNVANDPKYKELALFFRKKLSDIVLGDGRVETIWTDPNTYEVSNYAKGAHDGKLKIPNDLIPQI